MADIERLKDEMFLTTLASALELHLSYMIV
jgi:hypothetical protein